MSKLRVLFICTGNTCRSPMAEGIFNQINEEFPEIEAECASTGVSAVKGQRVTPWARQVCEEIGVDISQYRANYFTMEQMMEWDILAVMSQDQYILLPTQESLKKNWCFWMWRTLMAVQLIVIVNVGTALPSVSGSFSFPRKRRKVETQ